MDVGVKSFTGVVMQNEVVKAVESRDLSVNGKDLPQQIEVLHGVCQSLLEKASAVGLLSVVLVEKQLGKFAYA